MPEPAKPSTERRWYECPHFVSDVFWDSVTADQYFWEWCELRDDDPADRCQDCPFHEMTCDD